MKKTTLLNLVVNLMKNTTLPQAETLQNIFGGEHTLQITDWLGTEKETLTLSTLVEHLKCRKTVSGKTVVIELPDQSKVYWDNEKNRFYINPGIIEAAHKIKNAIENGTEFLDLSGYDLTMFPYEIRSASHLKHLRLDRNNLKSNQLSLLKCLPNLETLSISNNNLTHFPPSLGELKNLRHLNMSLNQLSAIPSTMAKCEKLETLDLSYNKFEVLPDYLGKLKGLKVLDVSWTSLTHIPELLIDIQGLDIKHHGVPLRDLP